MHSTRPLRQLWTREETRERLGSGGEAGELCLRDKRRPALVLASSSEAPKTSPAASCSKYTGFLGGRVDTPPVKDTGKTSFVRHRADTQKQYRKGIRHV